MKKVIEKTNGKKTGFVAILMGLFQAFVVMFPDLMNERVEDGIEILIASGVIPTLLHRLWRNRDKIFKRKKNA